MKKTLVVFGSTLIILFLGACGGSGGGISVQVVEPAVIDTGNAQKVAGSSLNAALQSGGFGNALDGVGLTTTTSGGASKLYLGQTASKITSGYRVSQVPVGPETTPCAVSGSVTVSGDIANPATLSAGDFLDIRWNSCDDGFGDVIDGLLGIRFTRFEGDISSGQILLGIALNVDNFQVTTGADINSADGDISLTIDARSPPLTVASSSGSAFTINSNNSMETLSNFSSTVTEDAGSFPSGITTVAMGTVTSSQFDGSVSYNTPVAFQSIGNAYPYAGELLVTGANSATLRLIALDDVNVRIEADYDGDGAIDETINTTWDALVNQ